MTYRFHTLDVFTTERFCGNPLAVVLDADAMSDQLMQQIAREFNLSETVFVMKPQHEGSMARVRIFTPGREVPFAGHPTIGTAVLLADTAWTTCSEIRLEEEIGIVDVHVDDLGDGCGFGQFASPVLPSPGPKPPSREAIAKALAVPVRRIGFADHKPGLVNAGNGFLFVPVERREDVEKAALSAQAWRSIFAAGVDTPVGAFVYCAGGDDKGTHFHGRMFPDPSYGIVEDPATGSCAATFPGQLLAAGALQPGTNRFQVEQGYEMSRPSLMFVEAELGAGAIKAVRVGGNAIKVSTGQLTI